MSSHLLPPYWWALNKKFIESSLSQIPTNIIFLWHFFLTRANTNLYINSNNLLSPSTHSPNKQPHQISPFKKRKITKIIIKKLVKKHGLVLLLLLLLLPPCVYWALYVRWIKLKAQVFENVMLWRQWKLTKVM